MENKPLILVTNDDGITANGIKCLVDAVKDLGEILIVAPNSPQSGTGHAITIHHPLRMEESVGWKGKEIKAYSTSGTPVDCVKLAIYEITHRKPDLLLSGINHGYNSSTNVLYSGTMSAAVEGALEGIPSIGFSLGDHAEDADFSAAMKYAARITESAIENGIPEGVCLNVNFPPLNESEIKGVKVCRQARAFWADKFDVRKDPSGKEYYWLTGEFNDFDGGEDTDIYALKNNYVSIVPTQFDMTAHHAISGVNSWKI